VILGSLAAGTGKQCAPAAPIGPACAAPSTSPLEDNRGRMRCFTHQSVEAVAICKSCGRALCPQCVVTVGTICACRDRCEKAVEAQADVLQRSITVYQKTASTYFRNTVFVVLMGIAFCFLGAPLLSGKNSSSVNVFFFCVGLLFIAWGISQFVSGVRMRQK